MIFKVEQTIVKENGMYAQIHICYKFSKKYFEADAMVQTVDFNVDG